MRGEDGMVRTVRHLLLIDLDGLKEINDTFGHERGDHAIKGIAEELRGHFRDTDIIGRVGGDEFMAYLRGAAPRIETIEASIQKLLCKLGERFIGPNDERHISCSIGGAVPYDRAENFETLFARADAALYHVKRGGKSGFAFYSPEMTL